ncbi:MAG: hypothetical protein A2138_17095 [Deltaproteobacteria bacterium RBG_16_71_12]|nr:MAG: hypothetical protein A2138_17095 [Deltaproteobacteria bacterium RBG_16_71_12]
MEFTGTERLALELFGTMPAAGARERTGGNVAVDDKSGKVPVALTVLALEGVRPPSVPLQFTYVEVLWRIGVVIRKKPAWLIVAVDVDRAVARGLVRFFMGYPTRRAGIDINESARNIEVGLRVGEVGMTLRAELNTSAPTTSEKRMLAVRDGARFFKVPWGDRAPNSRQGAYLTVTDAGLGAETFATGVEWEESGAVWRTREHLCGTGELLQLI